MDDGGLRKVLVTGGSSGIGAATAREFAARGCRVAVAGRDRTDLAKVAADTGGIAVPGDLARAGAPRATVDMAAFALGGLDVVVSNAGVGWSGPFAGMDDAEIDALLDVNLRAAAHLTRASLRYLRPDRGHLVYVGSIAGVVGVAGEAWYSATKAGLTTLAAALRAELKDEGIGVTLVTPGVVDTPYFDRRKVPYQRHHPRPVRPELVAGLIADAVARRRDEVIVPGWLMLPARLKVSFPRLYRLLESRFA
ncbi:MAG: SDR family oxidoreductase [Streptosporangiales bacterium]|nr:SDR family oxidoreductase [Streptosporangiales bacterium]